MTATSSSCCGGECCKATLAGKEGCRAHDMTQSITFSMQKPVETQSPSYILQSWRYLLPQRSCSFVMCCSMHLGALMNHQVGFHLNELLSLAEVSVNLSLKWAYSWELSALQCGLPNRLDKVCQIRTTRSYWVKSSSSSQSGLFNPSTWVQTTAVSGPLLIWLYKINCLFFFCLCWIGDYSEWNFKENA